MSIARVLKGEKVKRLTVNVISKVSANRYIVQDEKTPAILEFNNPSEDLSMIEIEKGLTLYNQSRKRMMVNITMVQHCASGCPAVVMSQKEISEC